MSMTWFYRKSSNKIWRYVIAIMLSYAFPAWCEVSALKVVAPTKILGTPTDIGSINVPSLGKVSFVAKKNGTQIVILAKGPNGALLGRAEATVGLNSTPIHIATPKGLKKIEIIWNSSEVK